ncbi:MAG: class I SAM-dependent methyltransferase, partial [Bacteroidota bacterium]
MKIHRNISNTINYLIDEWIPPAIRDSKLFIWPAFHLLFGEKKKYFMEFKEKAPFLTKEEYREYYRITADKHIERATDLNTKSIEKILADIKGQSVLDAGAGRGYLADLIVKKKGLNVTGMDIYIPVGQRNSENPRFIEGDTEEIPFPDNSFDTVICTHTLEHVMDKNKTLSELRRVAQKRLIIVVPRQRENKYTFDLHLSFFPYPHSLLTLTRNAS